MYLFSFSVMTFRVLRTDHRLIMEFFTRVPLTRSPRILVEMCVYSTSCKIRTLSIVPLFYLKKNLTQNDTTGPTKSKDNLSRKKN